MTTQQPEVISNYNIVYIFYSTVFLLVISLHHSHHPVNIVHTQDILYHHHTLVHIVNTCTCFHCTYRGMASAFDCGFARSAVREAYRVHQAGDAATKAMRRKQYYDEQFQGCDASFSMEIPTFTRRSQALSAKLRVWRDNSKDEYFREFSLDRWRDLPTTEKQKHHLENCVQCETTSSRQQSLFDAKCNSSKKKGKPLRDITNTSTPKPTKKADIADISPIVVKQIETAYKRKCEDVMKRDGKDLQNLLANGVSYRGYDRERRDRLLEPYDIAAKRTVKRKRVRWERLNIDADALVKRTEELDTVSPLVFIFVSDLIVTFSNAFEYI